MVDLCWLWFDLVLLDVSSGSDPVVSPMCGRFQLNGESSSTCRAPCGTPQVDYRWTSGLLVGRMNIRTLTDLLCWPQPQIMTSKMNQLMEAELGQEIEGKVQTWAQSLVYTVEELECKICYNRYNTRSRKPKLLGCLHRVCAKCLKKMVDMGDSSPTIISCPFCRHETYVPDEEVWLMEDDRHIMAVLSCQDRAQQEGSAVKDGGGSEGGLTPTALKATAAAGTDASLRSSDCLVITIMELPDDSPSSDSVSMINVVGLYRPPSLDSLPCSFPSQKCRAWTSRSFPRCLLGALCMVYFSSLPLGIYLLMMGQLLLGVVLVSLVPSTLLLLVLYGFCQCICHEVREAIAARRLP
ncbi:PREDICTED: E3 ubiquitin-protein ligase RNF182-like isoform X1 [Poecilia mexicana]|uniref:E3 ubiquitin-protein ligase RNF182-like isoform X1 n=2 Tax=Poecilia mexicana TaxID=48701 RepID=UPI00072E4C36|nr:PREDICTED: E3 ubiquitin-protein ligase RNF182-like isoform X1 [Poecilia mexicana]